MGSNSFSLIPFNPCIFNVFKWSICWNKCYSDGTEKKKVALQSIFLLSGSNARCEALKVNAGGLKKKSQKVVGRMEKRKRGGRQSDGKASKGKEKRGKKDEEQDDQERHQSRKSSD